MIPSVATAKSDDERNSDFWAYICGSQRKQQFAEGFDAWYWNRYPWLEKWIPFDEAKGARVLEVGIGSGVTARRLASLAGEMHALDVARQPLDQLVEDSPNTVIAQQGSILSAPYKDDYFDLTVCIGCVHHTGNVPQALSELARITRGSAVLMVYHKDSGKPERPELWDADPRGNGPPFTEWFGCDEFREMLVNAGFRQAEAGVENYRAPNGVNVYARAWK